MPAEAAPVRYEREDVGIEDVLGCMIACVHPKHMSIASRHIVRCDTLSGSVIKQQNKATIL
jgi:hypothetical protein